MDGIATNCYFANGPSVGCPWHCKINKGIIIKFKWLGFQIITIKIKKNWLEWHYFFLLSCSHENGHFWPFFTIQIQGVEQTTTMLFILNVMWCSNNQMQKRTPITYSIYEIWKYFSKILLRNFGRVYFLHRFISYLKSISITL